MPPSDRDLAQQWLAGRLHAIECGRATGADEWENRRAAAILDTPGVEVEEKVGSFGSRSGAWILADDHYGTPATHRRLVIMLPAEERSGVAAHQQDRAEEQG